MTFLQRHAYSFGCGLAALAWPFFRGRRRVSVENILRGRVTDDPREARRLARRAFCHFAGHVAEALFVPRVITRENWREHLDFADATPLVVKTLLDDVDTPILLVSAHHGVWEAATNLLSFARPMIAVARVMNNSLLAHWIKRHHFRGPVTIVNKNDGFRERFIRQWLETNAAMTLLTDQHAYGGVEATFFGRPARTVTSAARLAIRYGCPVVVGSFVRLAPYRYRLVGEDPVRFAPGSDRQAAVQLLNDRLEAAIRKYPEQYLWMHRRWRDD